MISPFQTFPLYKAACACKGNEIVNACMTYVYVVSYSIETDSSIVGFFFQNSEGVGKISFKKYNWTLNQNFIYQKFELDEMRTKIWSKCWIYNRWNSYPEAFIWHWKFHSMLIFISVVLSYIIISWYTFRERILEWCLDR